MRVEVSRRLCVKAGESTVSMIAESNLLESNGDVRELKAFVCLFLITMATPLDGLKG